MSQGDDGREQPPAAPGWTTPGSERPGPPAAPPGPVPPGPVPPGSAPPPTGWGQPAWQQPQAGQQWPPPQPGQQWGGPAQQWGVPPGQQPRWAAPKPGVVPLRPLGLGELLDGAVQTVRFNPKVMFGLSTLVVAVAVIVSTALQLAGLSRLVSATSDPNNPVSGAELAGQVSGTAVPAFLSALLLSLALAVLTGVLVLAVSDAVIARRPTPAEVVRRVGWRGAGRLMLLIGSVALLNLVIVAAVVGLVVATAYASPGAAVAVGVVLVPALIVGLIWLNVPWAFSTPVMVLEHAGVIGALRRSRRLVKGSFWRVLGILLLTSIIAGIASGLLSTPFSLVGVAAGVALGQNQTQGLVVSQAISGLGSILGAAVSTPFSAAVSCLLYVDLRIRREGLDVALAQAAASAPADGTR